LIGAFLLAFFQFTSGGFYDFARFKTLRANFDSLHLAIDSGANLFQIWQPAALAEIVCVANSVAPHRAFTADVTSFCH
jgi:hypothetical protein